MRRISDEYLLECLTNGTIVVRGYKDVYKWHERRQVFVRLKAQEHYKGGRVYYNLRFGSINRKVFRARLFYMWSTREVVPDGLTIDHVDHVNTNDHPDNLRLATHSDNSSRNWSNKEQVPF